MIEKLTVKDIAVVESAEIVFGPGLNVVTGETGAGKSVLIGAIDLLSGGRADHSIIRQDATQGVVMAELFVPVPVLETIAPILEDAGVDACEEGRLILRRTISKTGSGRCLVNNCPVTVQTMRKIGMHLVDMHGPHDNQSLLDPAFQLDALDAFGQCQIVREAFATVWRERQALFAQRDELSGDSESVERELSLLRHQIQEIGEAELSPDTDGDALIEEHAESANSARLLELGSGVLQMLSEGEGAAVDVLATAIRTLEEMTRSGAAQATEWAEEVRSASIQLNELSQAISSRMSRIDVSPERLQWLDERMTLVEKLKRKYGSTIDDILIFYENAQARAADLETRGDQLSDLACEIERVNGRLNQAGKALTAARLKVSAALTDAVSAQLTDLGLPHAGFCVQINPSESERMSGCDLVEFGFAPNPGEPMRALRSIASSGEISRVMLALKTVLAQHDHVPILVFDEIDANVGGEIADSVGAKLVGVGHMHQVICITHLPQVAAWGLCHFAVKKNVIDGRTLTTIFQVAEEDRVNELARMLGGAHLTSVTLDHARELLASKEGCPRG